MKKKDNKFWIVLCLALFMQSCNLGDLMDDVKSVTEGVEEDFVIKNKNYGEQYANEPYAEQAANFEVQGHPDIRNIEFLPDGSYVVNYSHSKNNFYDAPQNNEKNPVLMVESEGKKVQVALKSMRQSRDWSSEDELKRGTYTCEDGKYILHDRGWMVEGNTLYINEYGEVQTYTIENLPKRKQDELTRKLCHTWDIQDAFIKLYSIEDGKRKLWLSYQLNEEEMKEYLVKYFIFSQTGYFYRFLYDGSNNGNGDWDWTDINKQILHYNFLYYSFYETTPVYGENDVEIYFSNNNLYLMERVEVLDEDDDYDRKLEAQALYKLELTDKFKY